MVAERDWNAIGERCTRFVPAQAAWRKPADVLRELADRAVDDRQDVYGRGGAVERLETRVAEILSKEAALLFPTGTMAQQIALRIWSERAGSRTVAFHPQCHLDVHEERGYEQIHEAGDGTADVPPAPLRILAPELWNPKARENHSSSTGATTTP